MEPLGPILESLCPQPILLGMDSNLHHPMCNPQNHTHVHQEADRLISLMKTAGLLLWLEAGVLTFTSSNTQGSQKTVDLQWLSPDCYNWATVCKSYTGFEHSHFSDYMAIVMELDLSASPLDGYTPRPRPN
ncbi:hypothetical protein DFH28DRAFT_899853 [Melampsora americana]|nr:hypothetical protein DFH28DRAFT_899853 [Melampsora americana]